MKKRFQLVLVAGLLMSSGAAWSWNVDGASLEYGQSDTANADIDLYRVGLQWDWDKKWFDTGGWHLGGYWDLNLGYWDNSSPLATNSSIIDIGLTPVFRWQENQISGISPYVELAVGFHFLSHSSLSPLRDFGSSFQFGDHIGFGVRFGDKGAYDLGYRYQHLSNAGIVEPNQGIEFHQIRLQHNY